MLGWVLLACVACGGTVIKDDGAGGAGSDGADGSGPSGSDGDGDSGSGAPTSGSGSSGAGGASLEEFNAYCDKRAISCGEANPQCKAQAGCALDLLKDGIESELLLCLSGHCGDGGGECLADAIAVPLTQVGEQFRSGCDAYSATCGSADDICAFGYLLSDPALEPFLDCFQLSGCTAIDVCVEDASGVVENCDGWL